MKKTSFSNHSYKFAIVLSILIHLLFVATVEAAVFLGRVFDSPVREFFITIQTTPRDLLKSKEEKTTSDRNLRTSLKKEVQERRQSESEKAKLSKKKSMTKSQTPHVDQKFQSFERSQAEINRRIQDFENNLATLSSRQNEMTSRESVALKVFDLEKVPVEVREDLLPSYLKRMRARIAKFWVQSVESLKAESAVAVVQYRISANGSISVLKARLINGPGIFAETCLAAVQKASPFEPLPFRFDRSVENQYLTVALTFYFRKSKT